MGNFCSGGTRSGKDDPLLQQREEAEKEEYLLKCKVAAEELQKRARDVERQLEELQPRIQAYFDEGSTQMAATLITQKKHLEQQRDASYTQIVALQKILNNAEQFGMVESITQLLEQGSRILSPKRVEGVQDRMQGAVENQGLADAVVKEMNGDLRVFSADSGLSLEVEEELARMQAAKDSQRRREEQGIINAFAEMQVPSSGRPDDSAPVAVAQQ